MAALRRLIRVFGEWMEREPRGLLERKEREQAANDLDTRLRELDMEIEMYRGGRHAER